MDVEDAAGRILREVFGYPRFRGEQRQIIDHVVAGGDALVLMPTGGGFMGSVMSGLGMGAGFGLASDLVSGIFNAF